MIDLALLPLDDRPCNRLFPQQLARVAGIDISLPPRDALGWFTTPGDCQALGEWLRRCAPRRLVVSLDMLCYGGLVAGRAAGTSLGEARRRLDLLRARKQERPDSVVYAFSNVMRLGCTVTSEETLELHSRLFAYSVLWDRAHRLGEASARRELDRVMAELGPEVVEEYLATRERNHQVNLEAVRLVAEGVVDYLVLCQEDAAPVGLHVSEQEALREEIAHLGVADRVALHPGADEVGMVLMARHLADEAGRRPAISVEYASEAGARVTPRYEHQPLRDTVESQVRAAGARPVPPGEAEAVLFVHTPIGQQAEASEAPRPAYSHALQAERLSDRIQVILAAGRLAGVADVAYANGADPELVAALERYELVKELTAFAGWNTAANTVGTVAAHLCLAALAGPRGAEASGEFIACRLLDDWAYQAIVRSRARAHAEAMGANSYALGEAAAPLEAFVRSELEPFAHQIASFGLPVAGPASFRVTLPWKRLFEVEVELEGAGSTS